MKRLPTAETAAVESENEYYARVSRKLRNTKYLLLLLMVVTAVLTLFAYRGGITYENLRYLLRDIDEAGHTTLSADAVYYTASDTNTFLYFRDDLAVASSDGVAFHRALGSRSFEDAVTFKSPLLTGSDKYMLAYDAGGYSFYVYNSISRVYSETLETPIIDCAAADNGSFAVLTKNNIGGYVIRLYDKNFKLAATLTREGYVYAIGFFADGRLYLCESVSEGAALYTDVSLYTAGSDTIDMTHRESGLVLLAGDADSGMFLLSDRGLTFLNERGEKIRSHSFGTSDVLFADATDAGVCVLLDENTSGAAYGAYAYFANGDTYSLPVEKGVKGIALCKKRICLLYDGSLTVYNGSEIREIEIPDGGRTLLRRDKDSVIVCYNDYAKFFSIN